MNPHVREKLSRILAVYGTDLLDARRCEALLRDLCPQDKRELHVLLGALREQVPADLASPAMRQTAASAVGRLAKRLEDNLGLAKEPARWAVESWALALGVATEQQLTAARPRTASAAVVPPPVVLHRSPRSLASRLRIVAVALSLVAIATGSGIAFSWSSPVMQGTASRAVSLTTPPAVLHEQAETADPAPSPAVDSAAELAPQPAFSVAGASSEAPPPITEEEVDIVRGALRPEPSKAAVDRQGDR